MKTIMWILGIVSLLSITGKAFSSDLIPTRGMHQVNTDIAIPQVSNCKYTFKDASSGMYLGILPDGSVGLIDPAQASKKEKKACTWKIIVDVKHGDGRGFESYRIVSSNEHYLCTRGTDEALYLQGGNYDPKTFCPSWAFKRKPEGTVVCSNHLSRRWIFSVPGSPKVQICKWYGDQNRGHEYIDGSKQAWEIEPTDYKLKGKIIAFSFSPDFIDNILEQSTPAILCAWSVKNPANSNVTTTESFETEETNKETVDLCFDQQSSQLIDQCHELCTSEDTFFANEDQQFNQNLQETDDQKFNFNQQANSNSQQNSNSQHQSNAHQVNASASGSYGVPGFSVSGQASYHGQFQNGSASSQSNTSSSSNVNQQGDAKREKISTLTSVLRRQKNSQAASQQTKAGTRTCVYDEQRTSNSLTKTVESTFRIKSDMVAPPGTNVCKKWLLSKAKGVKIPFQAIVRVEAIDNETGKYYDVGAVKCILEHKKLGVTNTKQSTDGRAICCLIEGSLTADLGLAVNCEIIPQ